MAIELGLAAKELRQRLKLSIRAAADELDISFAHLCNVENGKASLTPDTIERFHEAWGIDLYMYAMAFHASDRSFPKSITNAMRGLIKEWESHINKVIKERLEENSCSTLAN